MAPSLERAARWLAHLLRLSLVALLGYALVVGEYGLATNVALSLGVALIPAAVDRRFDRPLGAALTLWIVLAAVLHAVGITGLYRDFGWFDQFAHGVSGGLIAGVGYAFVRTVDANVDDVVLPADLRFLFVVAFTGAVGVAWEVAEFGLGLLAGGTSEALLVQFGLGDVVWDLVLDLTAAVVVALWLSGPFEGLRGLLARYVGDSNADRNRSA